MKLSIITTVYQAEKDLPRLLDSMMAQQSKELEFFLIDNGCTDGSAAICADYASRDSRFKIHVLKENIGYIGARNLGLDIVDADYIGFCDSDDFLEPGGYDKAVQELKRTEPDIYLTSWNTIDGDDIATNNPPFEVGIYDRAQISARVMPQVYGEIYGKGMLKGFMWKQVIKKSLIGATRFKDDVKPYEDMIFNAELFRHCDSIVVSNDVIYNYIVSQTSITGKIHKDIDVQDEYDKIYRFFLYMRALAPDLDCRIALANHILTMLVTMISISSRVNTIEVECKKLNKTLSSESLCQMIEFAKSNRWSLSMLKVLLNNRCFLPIVLFAKLRR